MHFILNHLVFAMTWLFVYQSLKFLSKLTPLFGDEVLQFLIRHGEKCTEWLFYIFLSTHLTNSEKDFI